MSVLGSVFDSLKAMSLWQLLLAFLACIGYALAQGGLLERRARHGAGAAAALCASGFALLATDWMAATMLIAFAVGGWGLFLAAAWLLGRWTAPVPTLDEAAQAADMATLTRPADSSFAPPRRPRRHARSA